MSLIEPKVDELLEKTDNDRFLLCAISSKRARDINDMMRGQRDRAIQSSLAVDVAKAAKKKSVTFTFPLPRSFSVDMVSVMISVCSAIASSLPKIYTSDGSVL